MKDTKRSFWKGQYTFHAISHIDNDKNPVGRQIAIIDNLHKVTRFYTTIYNDEDIIKVIELENSILISNLRKFFEWEKNKKKEEV